MQKRLAEIFVVAAALLAINHLVFAYILIDRDKALAGNMIGNSVLGSQNYSLSENLASLELFADIEDVVFSWIDFDNQELYVAGKKKNEFSSLFVSFDLANLTRIREIEIPNSQVKSGGVDQLNNFAYLGVISDSQTEIIKISLNDFAVVDKVSLLPEEGRIVDKALIDSQNQFAYFMSSGAEGTFLLKVNINPENFDIVSWIKVGSDRTNLTFAHSWILQSQKNGGNLYIANQNRINKIGLADFQLVDSLDEPGTGVYKLLGYDQDLNYLYYSTKYNYQYTQLRRIDLVNFSLDPAILDLNTVYNCQSMNVDARRPIIHYGYIVLAKSSITNEDLNNLEENNLSVFSTLLSQANSQIVKVNLNSFKLVNQTELSVDSQADYYNIIPDWSTDNLYLLTFADENYVHKINITEEETLPILLESKPLILAGEQNITAGIVNATLGYAYLAINPVENQSAKIVRITLRDFNRVDSLALSEKNIKEAFLDKNNHLAYWLTQSGQIIKLDLLDFSKIETLNTNITELGASYFDSDNQTLYLTSKKGAVSLVKVNIEPDNFSVAGRAMTSLLGNQALVVDAEDNYAYLAGSDWQGGYIVQIDLETMAELAKISTGNHVGFYGAIIDQSNNLAYFLSQDKEIIKIKIGKAEDFKYLLAYDMGVDFKVNHSYVQDPAYPDIYYFYGPHSVLTLKLTASQKPEIINKYLLPEKNADLTSISLDKYYGDLLLGSQNNFLYRYKYAPLRGKIRAFKINVNQPNFMVDYFDFYSYQADGNIKLALYDINKNLIWQSSTISNTAENEWLRIAITDKDQWFLRSLDRGEYWLAWQTDALTNIAANSPGMLGDGFELRYKFGLFPKTIRDEKVTADRWSIYGVKK